MTQVIKVDIFPDGTQTIDTQGFKGESCLDIAKELGKVGTPSIKKKAAFYEKGEEAVIVGKTG